jgi:hypothetical protein
VIQVIKKHKGLGDTVEFLLERTGIAYAVKMAAQAVGVEDCGCEGRKEDLNDPNLLVNKIFYGSSSKE